MGESRADRTRGPLEGCPELEGEVPPSVAPVGPSLRVDDRPWPLSPLEVFGGSLVCCE